MTALRKFSSFNDKPPVLVKDIPLKFAVDKLQKELLKLPQAPAPVVHSFSPGLYIRELTMKAGTVAIGHYQRFPQLNIVIKGKVAMVQEDGSLKEVSGPITFTGQPGKKVGYVLEDVVWLNVYPTNITDVDTLEEILLDKDYDPYNEVPMAQLDYAEVLREFEVSHAQARLETEFEEDIIPLPPGSYKIKLSKSPINGTGVFATGNIDKGEIIAPARIGTQRTPVGRYVNHSNLPNATFSEVGSDIVLVALTSISGCHGGANGEELTVDYRVPLTINKRNLICQVS